MHKATKGDALRITMTRDMGAVFNACEWAMGTTDGVSKKTDGCDVNVFLFGKQGDLK